MRPTSLHLFIFIFATLFTIPDLGIINLNLFGMGDDEFDDDVDEDEPDDPLKGVVLKVR